MAAEPMAFLFRPFRMALAGLAPLALAACGGNGGVPASSNRVPISVSVSGLSGGGLVLQDNGADALPIPADGTFTFATPVAKGGSYAVTVGTQPGGQQCDVTNGTGSVMGSVPAVPVHCRPANVWTWMHGSSLINATGSFGTQGVPAGANAPGARGFAHAWFDASGVLWLFGGYGFDITVIDGNLNDFWKCEAGLWTWIGGSTSTNAMGSAGVQGVPSASNIPGARNVAASRIDPAGTLWLFGGEGYDSNGSFGFLNDLWQYQAGSWVWVRGADTVNSRGSFGSQGLAAPTNTPSARANATSQIDASGTFWLFGGTGFDSTGAQGSLNDLWKFTAGNWMWVSGSSRANSSGVYGTKGVPDSINVPGARAGSASWMDRTGNFWLFGGFGRDSNGTLGTLNDLWEFSAGKWTWVGGPNTANGHGIYGTRGVAAAGNTPGSRQGASAWIDLAGTVWLFGGSGNDANSSNGGNSLSDLWKFAAGQWTWVSGSSSSGASGSYGVMGLPAPGNAPGARSYSTSWVDPLGNLWLLGGSGYDSGKSIGYLSDAWRYTP